MIRVVSVVGTRPNFMKIAPIAAAMQRRSEAIEHVLVHTGQHYDRAMSQIFLEELGVGEPQHDLAIGSGTHAEQTARVIERLDPLLRDLRPDLVLVPGDVNSTLAAAITAAKLEIPVGHVEAGLRSFDRSMPEELNRVLVDAMSTWLFIHSPEARDHLLAEGAKPAAIHDVGNTMIDTLVSMRGRLDPAGVATRHGLQEGSYLLVTLHRPALTDGPMLDRAIAELAALSERLPIVFPVHPRTSREIERRGLSTDGLTLVDPLGYLDFLSLVAGSSAVLTDSGGVQEETTFLGVPCFTLRENTERPVTVDLGTNVLLGLRPERIAEIPELLEATRSREQRLPDGWDGRSAERIVEVLVGSPVYV